MSIRNHNPSTTPMYDSQDIKCAIYNADAIRVEIECTCAVVHY